MKALASGVLAFALLVVTHVAYVRLRKPAQHYLTLAVLSLSVLGASIGAFFGIQVFVSQAVAFLPSTPFDYLNLAVLYAAFCLSYVTTFSAVQADSPTMVMLLRIEAAGDKGLTAEELLAQLDDKVLVLPRVEDLVTGGLARSHDGRYQIQAGGAFMARTHLYYRRLLKMEKGG